MTTLAAVHQVRPEANWGVATGRPSEVFVVDFDPAAAGPDAYAWSVALTQTGTRRHGTGGGGEHWFFTMPIDFEPRNVGRKARDDGRVPVGIDIRGWHGMAVLPPSVSGKGYYSIAWPGTVIVPPTWLLEAIRPRQREDFERPAGRATPLDQLTAGKWVVAAVRGELERLRDAQVGMRNDTAFATACRLVELVNAPWSGLDGDAVRELWWEAGAAHPEGVHVPDAELAGVWARAEMRVGGRPADEPLEMAHGELIPFVEARPEPFPVLLTGQGSGSWSGFVDAGQSIVGGLVGSQSDLGRTQSEDPVQAMLDRMLTAAQLRARAKPVPLVDDLLDLDTCAWLIGASGSFKTFVALDLAGHVARGEPWRGHRVRQGSVAYLAAEGGGGLSLRVDAWERTYGEMGPASAAVRFLPEVVPADERGARDARGRPAAGAWTVWVEACRRLAGGTDRLALVVIDTQSRVTVGLNENDNGDMAYWALQAERVRAATGACVLVVHHTGLTGARARGASSIDAAQDTELKVERVARGALRAKLVVDKQKDRAEIPEIEFDLKVVDMGRDPDTDRELSSLVLVPPGEVVEMFIDAGERLTAWRRRAIALYQLIRDRFQDGEGGTRAEIGKRFRALGEFTGLSGDAKDKAWDRAWTELIKRGLVAKRVNGERFKIVQLESFGDEGVLTPNDGTGLPPNGWNVWWPDDDAEYKYDSV